MPGMLRAMVLVISLMPLVAGADTAAWEQAGFRTEDAERWQAAGYALDEALAWKTLVRAYPHEDRSNLEEAQRWQRWGFSLEQVREYLSIGGSARAARRSVLYERLSPEAILTYQRAAAGVPEPGPEVRVLPLPASEVGLEPLPALPQPAGPYAADCEPLLIEAQLDQQALAGASAADRNAAEQRYRGRVAAYRRCLGDG